MHDLRLMVNQLNLICSSFAQLSCIALGGLLIVAGKITAGDLVNSMQLANGCFYAVNDFSERMAAIRSTKPISEKFTQLKAKKAPALPTENLFQSAGVRYEDVSFAFGEKTILSHFNYSFAPGKAYGIIGPSGSGKSTLVRLLMQYYDDYSGQITLDGADIREFPETALYKKVKYVEQSPHLFNATLRENITLFHSYPPQEVDAVIQKANLTALAAQCGDAPIGDEGNKISGGERQRIALARALLEKPEVIVFDEPTSALDPVNTRIIMELIFSMSGYTRLVITHNRDREMLSRFDEIITFGEE